MSTVIPSTKSIVKQLLTLASDPENQVYIAEEAGCMNGLVTYLSHADDEVVAMAVKTLKFLSGNPKNKETLKGRDGLVDGLRKAASHADAGIARVAQEVLDTLFPPARENVANPSTIPSSPAKPNPLQTIILSIDGLVDASRRQEVERTLIRVKGVVSVTVDQIRGQAIVCSRSSGIEDALQTALRARSITSRVFTIPTARGPLEEKKDADNGPMYLDDIYPMYSGKNNTVSTYGYSSLEARLEARRREAAEAKKRQERAERFITRVSRGIGSMIKFW